MKKILLIFILLNIFTYSAEGDLSEDFINEINQGANKNQIEVINIEIKPYVFRRDYKLRLISPIASKLGEVYNREYMYYSLYESLNTNNIEIPSSKIQFERKLENNE